MYNSKIVGNRLGSGCWSSYCGTGMVIRNSPMNSCSNLSGKILSSSVLFRTSLNYKPGSVKNNIIISVV